MFTTTNAIKWSGFLTAVAAAIAAATHGDYVSAVGIVAASLSSASAFSQDGKS